MYWWSQSDQVCTINNCVDFIWNCINPTPSKNSPCGCFGQHLSAIAKPQFDLNGLNAAGVETPLESVGSWTGDCVIIGRDAFKFSRQQKIFLSVLM